MPNVGNAWHLPANPEPRGRGGMRDPVGAVVAGAALTIRSGNQFAGPGNAADQLQDGSAVFARRAADQDWTEFPLFFSAQVDNNKYFEATIPPGFLAAGDTLSYLLRIAYGDRDTTYVHDGPGGTAVTDSEATARSAPFTVEVADPADVGRWEPVIDLPNVAVHAALLPTGSALIYGRRLPGNPNMHVTATEPFRWSPQTGVLPSPAFNDLNLFCTAHTHLADGDLLVMGGHDRADGHGLAVAFRYDADLDAWTPQPAMNNGRWYPTATVLPDGGVLVTSGSFGPLDQTPQNNRVPQIWRDGVWTSIAGLPQDQAFELYPRMHVAPNGSVVMTGPLAATWWLSPAGTWSQGPDRAGGRRDYAPSVQYRPDRVLYVGGGNDSGDGAPTAACEILPLSTVGGLPSWEPAAPMGTPRRQHNATVLPDGTVLVTGGTRGGGFNNLGPGAPVHEAELWDPAIGPMGQWRPLAAERVDRCYHATTLLLPDGRVFSAGGGEFQVKDAQGNDVPNDPQDSHANAQLFSPPYLFAGPRPEIVAAPSAVTLGADFTVQVSAAVPVDRVSLLRLGAVTHANAMDQRFLWLDTTVTGTGLTVTAPATPQLCPPGPYLLFVLSPQGVPSVAAVVRVAAGVTDELVAFGAGDDERAESTGDARAVRPAGTAVLVGIDGVCPYGIGACWGGANEALHRLTGVAAVDPVPDEATSTAVVRLAGRGLPPLDRWGREFHRVANGGYRLRGFEIRIAGILGERDGALVLRADGAEIELRPLADKVQWDARRGAPQRPSPDEAAAYDRLRELRPGTRVAVTGPITQDERGHRMAVRVVSAG
jgi:galactose oxidase